MTARTVNFDDRARDRDPQRWGLATEHYIDVVRNSVRSRLADGDDPSQAMLDGFTQIEAWLSATGEPGFGSSKLLVDQLDELFDLLSQRLRPADHLDWLRTPMEVLNGLTPVEAVIRHRIRSVLAFARSMSDLPGPTGPLTPGDATASGLGDER